MSKITWTLDQIRQFDHPSLATLPDTEQWNKMRQFLEDPRRTNLSKLIHRSTIPSYLIDKYGQPMPPNRKYTRPARPSHSRQNQTFHRTALVRRTLINPSLKENNKYQQVRQLFPKLSINNKDKIYHKFRLVITDFQDTSHPHGQQMIDDLYIFTTECVFILDLYIELYLILKQNNNQLYHLLIEKIKHWSQLDQLIETKIKLNKYLATLAILVNIYQKTDDIATNFFTTLLDQLQSKIKPDVPETNPNYLTVLCKLLTLLIPVIREQKNERLASNIDQIFNFLEPLSNDVRYNLQQQFMIEEVADLYYQDSD